MTRQLTVLAAALALLAWMRLAGTQTAADSVCPTCAPHRAAPVTDSTGGSSALTLRCAEEAPMTATIAEDFGLEALNAFLEQPNVVAGSFGVDGRPQTAAPAERDATIELRFDAGEFRYYEKNVDDVACDDSVRAPASVAVRIGDGLLSFEAEGLLWKGRHEPAAHFYASADLATAAGSYRPTLDAARVHAGLLEIALRAAPGHLRGDINFMVVYFRDEAELQRYRQGALLESWDRIALLFGLGFPDDACEDHHLPFEYDEPIERLGGRSAAEWRARAIGVIGDAAVVDAVWKDGRETEVEIEVGEPVGLPACLGTSGNHLAPPSELALYIPLAGRLRSADGELDMPIDGLVVGVDGDVIVRATLRSWLPSARLTEAQKATLDANVDMLEARITYDLQREPTQLEGIVAFHARTARGNYMRVGCVAFPRGGRTDVSDCRYE